MIHALKILDSAEKLHGFKKKMLENNQNMYEELLAEVMKPSRVFKERDYDYLEELFGD